MKIATFNINGINARLPQPARLARARRAGRRLPAGAEGRRRELPGRGDRGGRLRRGLARPAHLERRRHPGARRASRSRPRRGLPGDAGRRAEPLHRGGGRRRAGRLPLPAERQPAAGAEVRLQAGLVRAADRARGDAAGERARRSCWPATTTSCRPTLDIYNADVVAERRAAAAREPRARLRAAAGAGLDRRDPRALHPTSRIYTFWDYMRDRWQRDAGPAHRPPAAQPGGRGRRLVDAGVDREVRGQDERQRSRAGVGRAVDRLENGRAYREAAASSSTRAQVATMAAGSAGLER